MQNTKLFAVIFFREPFTSKEPVRIWIKELPKEDQKTIGHDILFLQYNWPIGMPKVKNLNKKLWELRINLNNRIARIIFITRAQKIIILHGFIKKTQKIPTTEIEIAQKRLKIFEMEGQ